MGAKRTSRLIAVLIAVAMIMTSAIGVFAASSPTKGGTTKVTVKSVSNIKVTTKADSVKYKVKGAKKWKKAEVKDGAANITGLKHHKKYVIKANGKTYYRVTCVSKVKKVTKKGKTVTVKFTKKKCAKKYTITAVRKSDGKVVKKTVSKTSGKVKLAKGKWKITVTVKSGKYVGKASKAKSVTIK